MTASIKFWPGGLFVLPGARITIPVTADFIADAGGSLGALHLTIKYAKSRLRFVSSNFGANFEGAVNAAVAGSVQVGAFTTQEIRRNQVLVELTFDVLPGLGNTSVTMVLGECANRNGSPVAGHVASLSVMVRD